MLPTRSATPSISAGVRVTLRRATSLGQAVGDGGSREIGELARVHIAKAEDRIVAALRAAGY